MSNTTVVKKLSKDGIKNLEAKVKAKQVKTEKADEATKAAVVKKITEKKDLTYKYPTDCDDLNKRKQFRAKARKALEKLEKNVRLCTKGKIEGKVETFEAELAAFKKATYQASK